MTERIARGADMTGELTRIIQRAREHAIGDLLRRAGAREPNRPALACGTVRWTFAEMDVICNRLAVLSRNSHAFAALRFAVARVGAVLVPINFMLNPDEINFILKSSGAKLLATGPDFVESARSASATPRRAGARNDRSTTPRAAGRPAVRSPTAPPAAPAGTARNDRRSSETGTLAPPACQSWTRPFVMIGGLIPNGCRPQASYA